MTMGTMGVWIMDKLFLKAVILFVAFTFIISGFSSVGTSPVQEENYKRSISSENREVVEIDDETILDLTVLQVPHNKYQNSNNDPNINFDEINASKPYAKE